jgi:hypothetical protein
MPCPEDLAIIEVDKAVKGVSPLLISSPRPGLRVSAFGDGDTTGDRFAPHDYRLRSADLVVLDDAECAVALRRKGGRSLAGIERGGAVCARGTMASLCYGDEGGPLARRNGRRWRLYGVASFHQRCGHGGTPSVYSDVRRQSSFVLEAKPVWRPRLHGGPRLVGAKAVGSTISCAAPKASGRVDVTIYTFLGEASLSDETTVRQRGVRPTYLVREQDRGTELACMVEVRNREGFDQDSVTVDIVSGPAPSRPHAWFWPPAPTLAMR